MHQTQPLLSVDGRDYRFCDICEARFLAPEHRPERVEEIALYRLHRNDSADPGYRRFAARLCDPLLERLAPVQAGLDFGCGENSAVAAILQEVGHRVALYDPLFHPNDDALERQYDFIVCSEAAEHFHNPAEEFTLLDRLLRPGGWLGVMTCFQEDDARFAAWHYRRDPTHVVFYRAATLRWIAARFGWSCDIPVKNVALMRKPAI